MTHLFAADEADGRVTEAQLGLLDEALGKVKAAGLDPEWLNVGASASLLAGEAREDCRAGRSLRMKTMMRPGLALYGVIPDFDPQFEPQEPPSMTAARSQLHPVMQWKTRVAGVRSISAGAVVGYNGTFVATEPMRLALWPQATPTASTGVSATASACWSTERALPLWAASAWIWQWWT